MSAVPASGGTDYALEPNPTLSLAAYIASDAGPEWDEVFPQMKAEAAAGDRGSRE